MDALILSCGTGGGHDAAGKAVYEEMKKQGHQVTMLNPYTLKSKNSCKQSGINIQFKIIWYCVKNKILIE